MGRPRINYACTVAKCEKPAYASGLCQMHRARLKNHGTFEFKGKRRMPNQSGNTPNYPSDSTMPREQRIIWAAGFFDGEGCICITRRTLTNGKRSCILQVSAVNTNKASVAILASLFGGSILKKFTSKSQLNNPSRWKDTWSWNACSIRAALALQTMLPYLVVKAEQAKIGLEFQEGLNQEYGRRGHPVPPEEDDRREQLRARLMALNRRGPRETE